MSDGIFVIMCYSYVLMVFFVLFDWCVNCVVIVRNKFMDNCCIFLCDCFVD